MGDDHVLDALALAFAQHHQPFPRRHMTRGEHEVVFRDEPG